MNVSWNNRLSKPRRGALATRFALLIASTFVLTTSTAAPLGQNRATTSVHADSTVRGRNRRCTFVDHSRSALNYSTTPYRIIPAVGGW